MAASLLLGSSLALAQPSGRWEPPSQPAASFELTETDGRSLLLETADWNLQRENVFGDVALIPDPLVYVNVEERQFIALKQLFYPLDKLRRATFSERGAQWLMTFDDDKTYPVYQVRLLLCPRGDAEPTLRRCANAVLDDSRYRIYRTDTPNLERDRNPLRRAASLRGLKGEEALAWKASINERIQEKQKVALAEKRRVEEETKVRRDAQRVATEALRNKRLALLDKTARGGMPTATLLARLRDLGGGFVSRIDDPCWISSSNGAWSTSNEFDARQIDHAGMDNLQIEHYQDYYHSDGNQRVRYNMFVGGDVKYAYDRQDQAIEAARLLRDLSKRCKAVR